MKSPESFVPLTAAPAPSASREFRVSILNGHDHATTNGDGTVKAAGFQSLETSRPATVNGLKSDKVGEPRVTIQRDGDRVTHLRIQCACGQIMDLACVYEPPQTPAT